MVSRKVMHGNQQEVGLQGSPSWAPALQGERRQKVLQQLQAAAEAARAAQEANMQRSGSGTGDILRTNFLVLASNVRQQDGHLLVPEELQLLQRFEVGQSWCEASELAQLGQCASSEACKQASASACNPTANLQSLAWKARACAA